jgi:hypothetical protein
MGQPDGKIPSVRRVSAGIVKRFVGDIPLHYQGGRIVGDNKGIGFNTTKDNNKNSKKFKSPHKTSIHLNALLKQAAKYRFKTWQNNATVKKRVAC